MPPVCWDRLRATPRADPNTPDSHLHCRAFSSRLPRYSAAQIKAHFIANGGQSRPFLISFASSLGFDVTIASYARCRAGIARAGDPVYGEQWAYVLGVKIVANPGGLPTAKLLNALDEIVSAHVIVLLL